jgi:hypothetical protein
MNSKNNFMIYIKGILFNIIIEMGFSNYGEHIKLIENNDEYYYTNNNEIFHKSGKHNQKIRIGKFIRRLFDLNKTNYKESDVSELVDKFKMLTKKNNFRIIELKGDGCAKYFKLKPSYGSHFLKNDCMGYEEKEKYFKFFELNSDKISILYCFDGIGETKKTYSGFVVLFHNGGKIYYDRIYGKDICHTLFLEEYCKKLGYIDIKTEKLFIDFIFPNPFYKSKENKFPYMDNMKYCNPKKEFLLKNNKKRCLQKYKNIIVTLHNDYKSDYIFRLEDTQGCFMVS